ncbi:unnamed protein product, partial [Mesorhabditis belari]|uniref:Staphylococcal nuclease domain-containing protein 1 n=1 Tax=Mesorhabditis belari TaxID=2138241 RepID=A0AAF3F575_9BILA
MADGQGSGVTTQQSTRRGVVKQVLSGDAIVLQGQTTQGPPPEATVYLSNVTAPRLGKRPTETVTATPDEPFAWEAREWLRKKLVGQVVTFVKDFTASSGRDHGRVYLGGTNPDNAENVAKSAVAEGLLEVRTGKISDEYTQELMALQEEAKAGHRGRWAENANKSREVTWVIDNPRSLVEKYHQKPIDAVIEMVRDGSTYRLMLLPSFEYITLQLSGVKSPSTRGSDSKPEPFANEAKFFVEVRLLQRDIQVTLSVLTGQSDSAREELKSYERPRSKPKKVDYACGVLMHQALRMVSPKRKKSFSGKVVEVVMNDSIVVLKDDGKEIKIHLSSVRLPREQGEEGAARPPVGRQFRPLYDIPFMFQAREFLRKRLIGKVVNVTVDYIQPKSEQYPEKICCTVKQGDTNIGEALIQRGLSKVVRHRSDDENRSSTYDALLAAEATAEKSKKGLYAEKSADRKDTQRIQELAGDAARSKQFLPYLQRGGRNEGVVEFIASGSRLRIYVPKETCLVTFLLGGINCPKGARPGGPTTESEPYHAEAYQFTRNLVMQHEVDFEVEGIDKMGNFIGYLFVRQPEGGRPQNLSELLVEQGLATVHHFSAEKSGHYNSLVSAEIRAKNARRNLWANFKEEAEDEERKQQADDKSERVVEYKKVAITDVQRGNFKFSAQLIGDGPKLEKLMGELREYLQSNPPMTGAYHPKRGELCVSKFSFDNQWYRAKVESIKAGTAEVLYVDYGNRETVQANLLGALPREFATSAPFAKEYALALTHIPNDKDYAASSDQALEQVLFSVSTADLNVEYRATGTEYAQVLIEIDGKKTDVGRLLVEDGYALAEKRREHRLQQLVNDYQEAEKKARRERRNIWEYGDFTGSEI